MKIPRILRRLAHSVRARWNNLIVQFEIWRVSRVHAGARVAEVHMRDGGSLLVFVHDSIGKQLLGTGTFEEVQTRYIRSRVSEKGVMVDVGANVGYWSVLFACHSNGGYVHAFEPSPASAALLSANVALNGLEDRIRVNQTALSAEAGRREFSVAVDSGFSSFKSTARVPEKERITVPTTTLDSYVAEAGIDRINFLKIDVEGSEEQVLRGAEHVLHTIRPQLLLIELTDANLKAYGSAVERIVVYLNDLGYEPFVIDHITGKERAYTTADQNKIQNIFFRPYGHTQEQGIHTK